MEGKIVWKKWLKGDRMGTAHTTRKSFEIALSEREIKDDLDYAETLFHELCHVWIDLVCFRTKQKLTDDEEHAAIAKMEESLREHFLVVERSSVWTQFRNSRPYWWLCKRLRSCLA